MGDKDERWPNKSFHHHPGMPPDSIIIRFEYHVQIGCLAAMWFAKESRIGVFFPVLIALLAPFRIALEKTGAFSKEELNILDNDDE